MRIEGFFLYFVTKAFQLKEGLQGWIFCHYVFPIDLRIQLTLPPPNTQS